MSAQKRSRQSISIEVKKQIIDAKSANSSKTYGDLAKEFSNSKLKLTDNNIKTIIRDKDKIIEAIDKGIGGKRARLKPAKYEDLEEAVLTWFMQVRTQNVAVDGPTLKVNFKSTFQISLFFRKNQSNWLKS